MPVNNNIAVVDNSVGVVDKASGIVNHINPPVNNVHSVVANLFEVVGDDAVPVNQNVGLVLHDFIMLEPDHMAFDVNHCSNNIDRLNKLADHSVIMIDFLNNLFGLIP
jgi:hypothetical protein